jgi:hypothetical protein
MEKLKSGHKTNYLVFQLNDLLDTFVNLASLCSYHLLSLFCVWVEKSCIDFTEKFTCQTVAFNSSWKTKTILRPHLFQFLADFESSILGNPKIRWLPESRIENPADYRFPILGVIWLLDFSKSNPQNRP